jgi:hypothetical protein
MNEAPVDKTTKKAQLNCRISAPYRQAAKVVAAMNGINQDQVVELALAVLFGVDSQNADSPVNRLHKRCTDAAQRSGSQFPTELFSTLTR